MALLKLTWVSLNQAQSQVDVYRVHQQNPDGQNFNSKET